MKLLAIGRPRPGLDAPAEIARHAEAELRSVWRMYVDGFVREIYSPGAPGVILILEAPDAEHARASLAGLPLAASGIIDFEVIELRAFAAFEMLFDNGDHR